MKSKKLLLIIFGLIFCGVIFSQPYTRSQLQNNITSNIYENPVHAITGAILQNQMLGQNYSYMVTKTDTGFVGVFSNLLTYYPGMLVIHGSDSIYSAKVYHNGNWSAAHFKFNSLIGCNCASFVKYTDTAVSVATTHTTYTMVLTRVPFADSMTSSSSSMAAKFSTPFYESETYPSFSDTAISLSYTDKIATPFWVLTHAAGIKDSACNKYGTLVSSSCSVPTIYSIGPGANGYVWTSNGTSAYPSWKPTTGDSGIAGSSSIAITATIPRIPSIKSTWVDANNWSITGNAGTTPGTNFLGTNDQQPLEFKVDGIKSGWIDDGGSSTLSNTSYGYQTLLYIGTGNFNVAIGLDALELNNNGANNTAVGFQNLFDNQTGSNNTGMGYQAIFNNSSGHDNTAVGSSAINSGNASFNTAIGSQALADISATSASNNTAVGYFSLNGIGKGSNHVAIGSNAGANNVNNFGTVFVGYDAGNNNTADDVVGLGDSALYNNLSGINEALGFAALANNTNGTHNTAIGFDALFTNITASSNVALGYKAGYNTIGDQNVFTGDSSGYLNSSGAANVFEGYQAGYKNTSGSQNAFIGMAAGTANTTGYYNLAMGFDALASSVNKNGQTACGAYALEFTTGGMNTAGGYQAGYLNTTGTANSYWGDSAGYNPSTSSSGNIGVGVNSLKGATGVCNYNTFIGYHSQTTFTAVINSTALGNSATVSASNTIQLGNSAITAVSTNGNYTVTGTGNGLIIPAGNNCRTGTATLSSGTVTVSNTAVTASSIIFVTYNTVSGSLGSLAVPAASISAGSQFVINSYTFTASIIINTADNSTVNWFILN